ncbi:MAG: hypothetical protein V8R91_13795 [Butyricimonas faecihominis]
MGLQTKAISLQTQCTCSGGAYIVGGKFMKCHHHSSPVNLLQSIENSCNPYYANVFKKSWNYRNIKRCEMLTGNGGNT